MIVDYVKSMLILMMIFSVSQKIVAGPPFLTDDPEPVDLHHWEFYVFANLDKNNIAEEEPNLNIPAIEFNYGALPNLQLHFIIPYAWCLPPAAPPSHGIGDSEIGFKYRFVQETKTRPQISIFPQFEIPTGDAERNLGNSKVWFKLPIWLQKTWGSWTTYGGGGYAINHATNERNFAYAGWTVQKSFQDTLSLGIEIFTEGATSINSSAYTIINAGGSYNFNKYFSLLFTAGHSVLGENHTVAYLGCYWTGS